MQYKTYYESPIGQIAITSDGEAITGLWLPKHNDFELKATGSEFREQVWEILLDIPYGVTVTYGDIAKKIAIKRNKQKMSSQAVGGAVGTNPISIMIPCHRVVGKDGSLTGYGGGIDTKIELLQLEQVNMKPLYRPKHSTKP